MKRIVNLIIFAAMIVSSHAQVLSPSYDASRQRAEDAITAGLVECSGDDSTIYQIPVVFHVLNVGDPIDRTTKSTESEWSPLNIQPYFTSNVAREQITTTIDNVNKRLNNTWLPYWEEDPEAISVNTGIELVLAHRDPNGNPTSGIVRHNLSNNLDFAQHGMVLESYSGLPSNELAIKQATGWPVENYLNVWIVPEINNNDAGCGTKMVGTFPTQPELSPRDGIVIQANRVGYGNFAILTAAINSGFTEAIGSYLGLYQTWHDTPSCEDANNEGDCSTEGDKCCDTPPTPRNCSAMCSSRCPSPAGQPSQNFYTVGLDTYPDTYNYMDDTGGFCKRRFTQDQACRMRSTLQNVRTGLANQAWIQGASLAHNLGVDVYLDRTGFHKFIPTVTVENSGDFTESDWSVDISVSGAIDPSQTYTWSYDNTDLGSLKAGNVYNIDFPEIQMKDIGEWSVTATVTCTTDEYSGDDQETYTFTKGYDGALEVVSNYRKAFWTWKQFDIYDVTNEEVVMKGSKYWANGFVSNKIQARENYQFVGYMNDLYGNKAGYATIYNATGVDEPWQVEDTWYLPPGEYIIRFYSGAALTGAPEGSLGEDKVSHLNIESCRQGCNFSVITNGTDYLYDMDETWLEYLGDDWMGFNMGTPVTSAADDVNYMDIIDTSAYPLLHRFSIPEQFVSTETCISGPVSNGWCDNALNHSPVITADVDFTFSLVGFGSIETDISLRSPSWIEPNEVNVQLSDDNFATVLRDTVVSVSTVHDQYISRPASTKVLFEDLVEGARYWARIQTDGYPTALMDTVTRQNVCFDVNGDPITFVTTSDGYEHDVISIGDQCWFAEFLKTGVYNDGTPINQITDPSTYSATYNGVLHASYINKTELVESATAWIDPANFVKGSEDYFDGFYYNYLVYDDPNNQNQKNICPEPFRVASVYDYDLLGNSVGPDPHVRLNSPSSGGSSIGVVWGDNAYGWNGSLGTELYHFSGDILQTPGRYVGFGAVGAWKDIEGRRHWVYPNTLAGWQYDFPMWSTNSQNLSKGRHKDYYPDGFTVDSWTGTLTTNSYVHSDWTNKYKNVRCVSGAQAPEVILGNTLAREAAVAFNPESESPFSSVKCCNFDPIANQDDGIRLRTDECGVCGGQGIPEGFCDCSGNVADAIGICGGDCDFDTNKDGICDIIQGAALLDCNPVDYNNYTYTTVYIDGQCWFQDNLRTDRYADGSLIATDLDNETWKSTEEGAWAYYNNDENNDAVYGKLYNWYAVNDSRGLCPTGWRVPTDNDWKTLETSLGVPRSELNSKGYRGSSTDAGNGIGPNGTTQFNGKYGGLRIDGDGEYRQLDNAGYYWTNNSYFTTRARYANSAWNRAIFSDQTSIGRYHDIWQTSGGKGHGMSVRCVLDE